MIQYLQLKKRSTSKNKFIVFREKAKKFDKKVKETYISKKQSLMLYGMSASGKTKEIQKIIKGKDEIWKDENFLILDAKNSISEWIQKNIKNTDLQDFGENKEEEFEELGLEIEKELNKQYVKIQMLIEKSKGAIVIIDDIDKLTGKKLEIAKDILRNSKQYIATAEDELSIHKTIKNIISKKSTKEISLSTDSSYDVTNVLIAMFMIALFVTGQSELAMLVMVARYMMKGKGK